ncbi:MAG: hypothetical protein KY452_04070 [Actinobacteria bacterium]|nr:hypothetical protein [Actinomycetota bacterium]
MRPQQVLRHAVSLAMGATLLFVGCDADSEKGTQPRPDVTTFEEGSFDDIPRLPASEPVSPPNEEEGVDTRSYVVRNQTPAEVLQFYELQLMDQTLVSAPEEIGDDTHRGRWHLDGGRMLTVSATPGETLEPSDSPYAGELLTQYSLSLAPAER